MSDDNQDLAAWLLADDDSFAERMERRQNKSWCPAVAGELPKLNPDGSLADASAYADDDGDVETDSDEGEVETEATETAEPEQTEEVKKSLARIGKLWKQLHKQYLSVTPIEAVPIRMKMDELEEFERELTKSIGTWDESKHPRDRSGRFMSKMDIDYAATDPWFMEQLVRDVQVGDMPKLEAALLASGASNQSIEAAEIAVGRSGESGMASAGPLSSWASSAPDIRATTKAEQKELLSKLSSPPATLPYKPEEVFDVEQATMVINPNVVIGEAEEGEVKLLEKRLALAAAGKADKHHPVVVVMRAGKMVAVDGEAALKASEGLGLHVPIHLAASEPTEWFAEEDLKTDKSPRAHSKQASYDEHLLAATENMDTSEDSFVALLDLKEGLIESIGADMPSYMEAIKEAEDGIERPMIVLGPIKTEASASRKVKDKYKGDFSKLTDVIRATVVVPEYKQMGPVLAALKSEARERGWEVVDGSGENKFVTPTDAGYRDVSMLLRSPNGQIAEMQVNVAPMWHAKETQGHKLYEEWRVLDAQREAGTLDASGAEELERLRQAQVSLYGGAWERSQGRA